MFVLIQNYKILQLITSCQKGNIFVASHWIVINEEKSAGFLTRYFFFLTQSGACSLKNVRRESSKQGSKEFFDANLSLVYPKRKHIDSKKNAAQQVRSIVMKCGLRMAIGHESLGSRCGTALGRANCS